MTTRGSTDGTGWGGRRPGAGRKRPTADPLYPREVRLTMAQLAFVNRHGGGHFATGLRRLIDEARAKTPPDAPVPSAGSSACPSTERSLGPLGPGQSLSDRQF